MRVDDTVIKVDSEFILNADEYRRQAHGKNKFVLTKGRTPKPMPKIRKTNDVVMQVAWNPQEPPAIGKDCLLHLGHHLWALYVRILKFIIRRADALIVLFFFFSASPSVGLRRPPKIMLQCRRVADCLLAFIVTHFVSS